MGGRPLKINGRWVCLDCHAPLHQPCEGGKKRRTALRCRDCWPLHFLNMNYLSGRALAAFMVSKAIQRGQLKPPRLFGCTDCDRRAFCYDHRDYGRPLDVHPVCRSCNCKRGTAKALNPILVNLLLAHALAQPI